jgi:hypothetical protein
MNEFDGSLIDPVSELQTPFAHQQKNRLVGTFEAKQQVANILAHTVE